MIKSLISRISNLLSADLYPVILFLWQRNRLLIQKNKSLHQTIKEQAGIIATRKEALKVVKNTKVADLATSIKRMQGGRL